MQQLPKQCSNCIHFHQDFDCEISGEALKRIRHGFCTAHAPQARHVKSVENYTMEFTMFPVVQESMVCGEFKPIA